MQRQYNLRNPAVKRLMKEAQELRDPTEQYHAQPLEDNLFEWHFTIRGPADSEFEEGLYHGRIILPPEYPMKPPSIILLTPNGRFDINKKICLSISGYHPESWQPCWSIRTALLAIIGFMPTHGAGAIGALDYSAQERKTLAKRSQGWKCSSCGDISQVLAEVTEASQETNKKAKELASQISFQAEKEKKNSLSGVPTSDSPIISQSSGQPNPTAPSEDPEDASPARISPNIHMTSAAQMPTMHANHPPPLSPFSPVYNVPMWQPSTNSRDSKFGPTFPLPSVSLTLPHGFPPQYFMPPIMPPNHLFYNSGLGQAPNVRANPASDDSQFVPSSASSTQPTSSADSSQMKESTALAQTTESTAQSLTTGSAEQLPTTGSTAQSPTTGTTSHLPTTGSTAQSPTTESTEQLPTTGSTEQLPTTGSTEQLPTTGSTEQLPTTGSTEQLPTTGSTEQSPTTGSTEQPNSRVRQRQPQKGPAVSPERAVPVSASIPQTREKFDLSVILVLLLAIAIILLLVRRLLMI